MVRDRSGRGEGRDRSSRSSGRRTPRPYVPPTQTQVEYSASQSDKNWDTYIKDQYSIFKPNKGLNRIRILPDTWEHTDTNDKHFGYSVYIHDRVGVDNSTYLCLKMMKGIFCPICEEKDKAYKENDTEYMKELRWKKKVCYFVIDRDNEKEGPQLWPAAAKQIDQELLIKIAKAYRANEPLNVAEPSGKGYDVEFNYTPPAGEKPGQYSSVDIVRHPTPLGNDAWVIFVEDNPIPDCLIYRDSDYIEERAFGKGKVEEDKDLGETEKTEEQEEPNSTKESKSKYSFEEIQDMRRGKLEDLAIAELGFTEKEVEDFETKDLREEICKDLKLESSNEGSIKDKVQRMREKY